MAFESWRRCAVQATREVGLARSGAADAWEALGPVRFSFDAPRVDVRAR